MSLAYLHTSGALRVTAIRAAEGVDDPSSRPLVAVVFAQASFEGLINEVLETVDRWSADEPVTILTLRAIVRAAGLLGTASRLVTKIQTIHAVVKGSDLDRGKQPWQDMELLIALRNTLVHTRSEPVAFDEVEEVLVPRLVQRLVERRIVELPENAQPTLDQAMRQASVGKWACNTVDHATRELAKFMPDEYLRKMVLMRLPDWRPGN
jgi:hypothetical protein